MSYNNKAKGLLVIILFLLQIPGMAQKATLYPGNWWVGMKNPALQLMVHGNNIAASAKTIRINYPGVVSGKIHTTDNPNYLFIDLTITLKAKAGKLSIPIIEDGKNITLTLELKDRRPGKGTSFAQGITSSDFIYFLMPDRFSNGDRSNDKIPGLRDQSLNRDSIGLRHGGDLQGIINHLDYIHPSMVNSSNPIRNWMP